MADSVAEIARRLAARAEAVCRHYLSQGRREGRYWLVGDALNNPGRSLYVRLTATPDARGAAGKWTDAATGEHGDLLDIIARVEGHGQLRDAVAEARRFLSLPDARPVAERPRPQDTKVPLGTPAAARRLFAVSRPIAGTLAEAYLRLRALADVRGHVALRFHPRCYYRPSDGEAPETRTALPAMIAAVTDLDDVLTGVHRTWLDPATRDKADVASPRRAMGNLLGNGVRFGRSGAVMAAGEGIETILSLRSVLPQMPMIAALSAGHLAAIQFPRTLRRLYVARDDDPAGDAAMATLFNRAARHGIEIVALSPGLGDFNEDLRLLGHARLRAAAGAQLRREDMQSYLVTAG